MLTGAYANSNYDPQKDGEEGARTRIVEQIEEQYKERLRWIYDRDLMLEERQRAEEAFANDPFFRSVRHLERIVEGREVQQLVESVDRS